MRLRIEYARDGLRRSEVFDIEDDGDKMDLPPGPYERAWLGAYVGSDDGDVIDVEQVGE